jgi:hypothetical protein
VAWPLLFVAEVMVRSLVLVVAVSGFVAVPERATANNKPAAVTKQKREGAVARKLRRLTSWTSDRRASKPSTGNALPRNSMSNRPQPAARTTGTSLPTVRRLADIAALKAAVDPQGRGKISSEARGHLREIASNVSARTQASWGDIGTILKVTNQKTSPRLEWLRMVSADPGKDWGYVGQATALREAQSADQQLAHAETLVGELAAHRDNIVWLAKVSKQNVTVPSHKDLAATGDRISAARAGLRKTLRDIKAGQLSEMMRLDEAGRNTAIDLDGVRGVFKAGTPR